MLSYIKKPTLWFVLILFFAQLTSIWSPQSASGEISSCSASTDPHAITEYDTFNVDFEIINQSSNTAAYILILKPSPSILIESVSVDNWSLSSSEEYVELVGSNLGAGETLNLTLTASIQDNAEVDSNWEVKLSEGTSGLEPTTCTGDLTFMASASQIPPVISNIKLSNLSLDRVTISWDTDEPTASQINYGETSGYGLTTTMSSTNTLHHSETITGLTPNTVYHYQVKSKDVDNNISLSEDNTFLTPDRSSIFAASTAPNTTLPTLTKIPIKAVPSETIKPLITIATDITRVFKEPPTITGLATDNEAIANIDYSLDGGRNWLQIEAVEGLGTKKVPYTFTPLNLKDDNYRLVVRAVDTSGNQTLTDPHTLVIDRSPPVVGGNVMTIGSQTVMSDKDGVLSTVAGVDINIYLSAVGGPTEVTILAKSKANDKVLQNYRLTQSSDSGLWSGTISFSKTGLYQLVVEAIDGAGNKTSRQLNVIGVAPAGTITDKSGKPIDATATIFYRDTQTNGWAIWDGNSYNQQNPVKVSSKTKYSYLLPQGTYYIKISAPGYRTKVSRSFDVTTPETINGSFKLSSDPLHLSSFWPELVASNQALSRTSYAISKSKIIGQAMPQFSLTATNNKVTKTTDLYGKPTIVTFVNTWASSQDDQLNILSDLSSPFLNVVTVASGESLAKIIATTQIAGYKVPILADTDNQLISALGVSNIPTTYFLDRHGVIQKVVNSVLTKEELLQNVSL